MGRLRKEVVARKQTTRGNPGIWFDRRKERCIRDGASERMRSIEELNQALIVPDQLEDLVSIFGGISSVAEPKYVPQA